MGDPGQKHDPATSWQARLAFADWPGCGYIRTILLEKVPRSVRIKEVALQAGVCQPADIHPFPPASDLEFLVGNEMGQIALDPYSLQFQFASGGQFTVEGRIEHIDEAGQIHPHDCQAPDRHTIYLHQLLQHCITKIEVESFCLSMTFEGGAVLRIFSDDGPYECGNIGSPLGLIVF